jgi:hypothetical protein
LEKRSSQKVFYPPNAEVVLKINLPAAKGDDFLAWHHDQTWFFSVKSAYRLALELKDKGTGTGTSNKPARERESSGTLFGRLKFPRRSVCSDGNWLQIPLAFKLLGVQGTWTWLQRVAYVV